MDCGPEEATVTYKDCIAARTQLIVFDMDGTLISSYMDNSDHAYDTWHILPRRRSAIKALARAGIRLAIATNQAGVAFGYVSEWHAYAKLYTVMDQLAFPVDSTLHVCFAHPDSRDPHYNDPAAIARRKPGGAMLHEAMAAAGVPANRTICVGDDDADGGAAADANVQFVRPRQFFVSSRPRGR
jgi:D-glycero-D-manno-heptose 1,7-bisphosphate phosphatase